MLYRFVFPNLILPLRYTSTSEDKLLNQGLVHQLLKLLESGNCQLWILWCILHALNEHQQCACSSGLS